MTSCSVFQPKNFNSISLKETIISQSKDSLEFEDLIEAGKGKKTMIQIYASYCPFSQDSFKDVVVLQKKYSDVRYMFLSVDHSFYDWKRGITSMKVTGEHYYIPQKGKGVLAEFIGLKTIPRFLLIDEEGHITVFKTSKVSDIENKLKR